jgi:hypothetical protein
VVVQLLTSTDIVLTLFWYTLLNNWIRTSTAYDAFFEAMANAIDAHGRDR